MGGEEDEESNDRDRSGGPEQEGKVVNKCLCKIENPKHWKMT